MHINVAGGGIAGTLLAWRLAQRPEVEHVELVLGRNGHDDATALSGGVVRGYERQAEGRRLAVESLGELLSSSVLQAWSRYRETGAISLRIEDDALPGELHGIEARLPGSAHIAPSAELARMGWAGLPPGTVGVVERRAGHVSAAHLRCALIADLRVRANVRVVRGATGALVANSDGTVSASVNGRRRSFDVVILATGAWTPSVLLASGLPSGGLRTKAIQCATYGVRGRLPMPFGDETSGLYGTPTAGGHLTLGMPTGEWDVPPGPRAPCKALHTKAARIARARMPWLQLGGALAMVNATDCFSDPPVLALRAAADEHGAIWTFTGGSGGSVKTALAASREAAEELLGARQLQPSPHGR
jgi:glycine/D-amino acid oxidase-like deaminating enzyme